MNSKRVKDYIEACRNWDDTLNCVVKQEADLLIWSFKPIESVIIDLFSPKEIDTTYPAIRRSEDFMFECCYLMEVTGSNVSCKYGLRATDIQEYRQQWRDFGIDPTLVVE